MNSEVRFYLALVLRRLPVMSVLFILCMGLGLALAMTLPPRYTAEAKLVAEGAKIPENLASRTVETQATERLQIIVQQIMARDTLIDVANRFNVFKSEKRLLPDRVVTMMRAATAVDLQTQGRNGATTMTISFSSEDPNIAASVVNELVTIVLATDSESRLGQTGDTLEFFEQQVARYSSELSQRSADIVAFKEANKDALPEALDYRMNRQSVLQERLNLISRDRASLVDQKDRLIAVGTASGLATVPLTPQQQQLSQLEAELNAALSIYSEDNPKVKLLRARIKQLTPQVKVTDADAQETETLTGSVLDLQLAEIDSRVNFIDQEIERTEAELAELLVAIEKIPKVAIRLDELQRAYEATEFQLNRAAASQATARSGADIEAAAKGERLRVLENAIAPSSPDSPNRKLIAGGGVFAGAGLAGLFFVLTELLNRTIRRPIELTRALGIQPLATIPYIEDPGTVKRRRALKIIFVVAVLLSVPIGLWAVHMYVMPLDLVAEKIAGKLGL